MKKYIKRGVETQIQEFLSDFPAVAILGPRQCGKTTLALELIKHLPDSIYLDLEKPSDFRKLFDPELFFKLNRNKLVCLDEIQRYPELFAILRSIIDQNGQNSQFLLLGSASRDLIRQSSESLAGRVSYIELAPFFLSEITAAKQELEKDLMPLWIRGGFPNSYLAKDDKRSVIWRENFIRTFLEQDIPQLGFRIPAETLNRLWRMLAHSHGQVLNNSAIGSSLGVSHTTVRSYVDLLSQTFMIRVLKPHFVNLKKRLVKSPKIYIRDSGILHTLLEVENYNSLVAHPIYGASWEGFALENIILAFSGWNPSFYRTIAGAEIDLILTKGTKKIGIEFKASSAPQITKGFWNALRDLKLDNAWIVAPVNDTYPLRENVFVTSLGDLINRKSPLLS